MDGRVKYEKRRFLIEEYLHFTFRVLFGNSIFNDEIGRFEVESIS